MSEAEGDIINRCWLAARIVTCGEDAAVRSTAPEVERVKRSSIKD